MGFNSIQLALICCINVSRSFINRSYCVIESTWCYDFFTIIATITSNDAKATLGTIIVIILIIPASVAAAVN